MCMGWAAVANLVADVQQLVLPRRVIRSLYAFWQARTDRWAQTATHFRRNSKERTIETNTPILAHLLRVVFGP